MMTLGADLVCYILAVILFGFAGFGVSFGPEPKWTLGWQWLAFMVLVVSLIL